MRPTKRSDRHSHREQPIHWLSISLLLGLLHCHSLFGRYSSVCSSSWGLQPSEGTSSGTGSCSGLPIEQCRRPVVKLGANEYHWKFTLIQVVCLAALWILKTSAVGILFPFLSQCSYRCGFTWVNASRPIWKRLIRKKKKRQIPKKKTSGGSRTGEGFILPKLGRVHHHREGKRGDDVASMGRDVPSALR